MIAYQTTTADAESLCAHIALLLGMPWRGRDAITGVERDDDEGLTVRWCAPVPHPSDPTRAYVVIDLAEMQHAADARGLTVDLAADPRIAAAVVGSSELASEWFMTEPG